MASTRFWGNVTAVRARLTLAIFENERFPTCDGHYLAVSGTLTVGNTAPEPASFVVAVGTKTQEEKRFAVGDLVRGNGEPVPETNRDCFADYYRVRTVHLLARATSQNAVRTPDPPRTDAPLSPEAAITAPRRLLAPAKLQAGGTCFSCPYGTTVAVVRLSDPRDLRRGIWSKSAGCLGPMDCPHYEKPDQQIASCNETPSRVSD
ncbi:MAG: hypothetical protein H7Y38_19415 [Armatimonadetes bacterium]|nr:hypothetical protein [Armatimonadota bacterium]